MNYKYILKDGIPISTDNLEEWSRFMKEGDRVVTKTEIGEVCVSTVFLGLDHSHGGNIPILFETLVFGGDCDGLMHRYATFDDARSGHAATVQWIKITQE